MRKKQKVSIKKKKIALFDVLNILFMLILCAVMVYPYLNQIALSFNTGKDAMYGGITIFPREFTLTNYITVFKNDDVRSSIIITVTETILGTVLALLVGTSAGYAMSRRGLPYRRQIALFLHIPGFISVGIIPMLMLYRELHLINSFWVYVIPGCFSFYNMVMIRSFMQGIPESLIESAEIDGANEIQIMCKVVMPLSKPILATVCLWESVGHWNTWTQGLYYITKPKLYTLQYMLVKLVKENEVLASLARSSAGNEEIAVASPTPETVRAATLIVATLPIVLMYPFLQKYFIKGVTLGAVKE